MSAPSKNQFWKLRSKHGREKLFTTPEAMEEAAYEYFDWCEKTPLDEIDYRGKDAREVTIPKMRAFTMQGLCLYLDCNTDYFRQFKQRISDKSNPELQGFSEVIARIEDIIYNQKFTGAAAGFLNPNIIARDLGLTEKTDNKHSLKLGVAADDEYVD